MNNKSTPSSWVAAVQCGLLCAVISVTVGIAEAALLFQSHLSEFLPIAVTMTILGAVIVSVVMSASGQIPRAISGNQEAAIVLLAAIVATITNQMHDSFSSAETVATALATIAMATLLFGIVTWLAGVFKLGGFLRYIPYPVLMGFLAAAAVLLVVFSLSMLLGKPIADSGILNGDFTLSQFVQIGLGLFTLAVLLALTKLGIPVLWMPVVLFALASLFHVVVFFTDLDLAKLIESNWTLSQSTATTSLPHIKWQMLNDIQWTIVVQQAPQFAILIIVLLSTLLIKIGTLEQIYQMDVDQDKELRVTGIANLCCGFAVTVPGFHTVVLSLIQKKMDIHSRLPGLFMGLFCLIALFFVIDALVYLPRFIFGGLLLWVAVDLLIESLVKPYHLLNRLEMGAVLLITFVVVQWGLLEGLIVGLIVGVVIFVIDYSRINIIAQFHTGADIRSTVDRADSDNKVLDRAGGEILIYRLNGYVFFGTAYQFIQQLKQDLKNNTVPVRYVLLDLATISGYDLAAYQTYLKLETLARKLGFKLLISGLRTDLGVGEQEIDMAELERKTGTKYFKTMDYALEWWEECVIEKNTPHVELLPDSNFSQFFKSIDKLQKDTLFRTYMQNFRASKNHVLVEQGAKINNIYFVESGTLDVQVKTESGGSLRLRKINEGACIGEISLYLNESATATIVCKEECSLWVLSRQKLNEMLADNPTLSSAFHERMAQSLAYRLSKNNSLLSALQL